MKYTAIASLIAATVASTAAQGQYAGSGQLFLAIEPLCLRRGASGLDR